MAEENTNVTTALAIVEEQQKVVGSALVAASGTAVLAENSDSSMQILEQIRDIQLRTLRGIGDIAKGINDMFAFDKLQDRRLREDETENNKEKLGGDAKFEDDEGDGQKSLGSDKKSGGMFSFLGVIPGAGFFKSMFAPIVAFLGKGGLLVKLFGKFGPLGALILGFTLVYKYADEIAAALAPAIDKIKDLYVKLKPAIDVLMQIGDFLIKGIIKGIGETITFLIGTVEKFIDGFKKLFTKDFEGAFNDIFEGILRTILIVPLMIVNFLKPLFLDLIDMIAEPWNNMVKSVNQFVADVFNNIKDLFLQFKDFVVGFFVKAYEGIKNTIIDAIQGVFNYIGDTFNEISNFMSETYTKTKNFITGLPDKIFGFVTSMFSPIIDFFKSIGNRIKQSINGVIDALPLPEFVKKKVRFNIEPTQDELDSAEAKFTKIEAPNTADSQFNKSSEFFAAVNKHQDDINKFMKATGYSFDLQGSKFQFEKGAGKYFSFDRGGEGYMTPADDFNADKAIDFINSGKTIGFADVKSAPTDTKTNIEDVGSLESSGAGVTVVNNNYNTNNSSVANQTDVHSGSLDTSIDTYHDKLATSSA